jgi:hypothetical protein
VSTENPFAPPQSAVADITAREAMPSLWNPGAAASWSLLFSPIFGSILHMKNWEALGDEKRAAASKNWAIGSVAFFAGLLLLSVLLPDSKALDALGRFGGLALLLAWYYKIGKSQSAIVLARYGKGYPRKGWTKPLSIAVGCFVAVMLAAVLVGVIAGMLSSAA